MEWLDEYNTGIAKLDQQHKKLINAINRLQDALTTTYVNKQMATTLKFLVSYTQHHFSEEEELMESIGYPEINHQKRLHIALIRDVREILLKLKNKEKINAKELINFLIGWLKGHIIEEDLKIGVYVRKLENKGNPPQPFSHKSVSEKLIGSLNELKKISAKKFITEEEYSNKKYYLINDFLCFQKIESKKVVSQYICFLDKLINDKLITEKEHDVFKKELTENTEMDLVLNKITDNIAKMEFINMLLENKYLTAEAFQGYKDKLLEGMN